MITALNRTQGRAATDGGMYDGTRLEVLDKDAIAVYARCLENTNEFSTVDRHEHALAVTGVVMRARRKENH